jgi:hypothetical protein
MVPYKILINAFEKNGVDIEKTITQPTNNGGAVTFQISDVLIYVCEHRLIGEIDFLLHLESTNQLTHNAVEHLFKHFFFNRLEAKRFVQWKRGAISA